jgi:hypothetical protein
MHKEGLILWLHLLHDIRIKLLRKILWIKLIILRQKSLIKIIIGIILINL